jgi:hypothetical protein
MFRGGESPLQFRLFAGALFAGCCIAAQANAQTSVTADGVSAIGTQAYVSNFACKSDVALASDGGLGRLEALCPATPVNPAYTLVFSFSPAPGEFLSGMRVWANGGNAYGDAELRQFDVAVDYFDPTTGTTETLVLGDQSIGDTPNDSDPKDVSFGTLFGVTEVRISDLRGVPSGTTGRPTFREIQGLFQTLPISPDITVFSSVNGAVADGATDIQGTQQAGVGQTVTYTVRNEGTDTLNLTGTPTASNLVNIAGAVSVGALGASSLAPGATTTFDATYVPEAGGPFSFDIAIINDDLDEGPYDIAVSGSSNAPPTPIITGPAGPQSGPFIVTIDFGEDVAGLDIADFLRTNATLSNLASDATGQVYTMLVTPTNVGEDVTLSLPAGAATDLDAGASTASNTLTVGSGALTQDGLDEIRDIIVEEAVRTTRRDLLSNQAANRSARDRFAADRVCQRHDTDHKAENDDSLDCRLLNEDVPLSFDGTLQATQGAAALSGSFFGQSTDRNGTRRLLSGAFDVTRFEDDDVTASFEGRVAWEKAVSDRTMLGYFVGAGLSQSNIQGGFAGSRDGYGLNAGAYFVDALDDNLFWDGFISAGIGQHELRLSDGTFLVGTDYRTKSLLAGLALSGEKAYETFLLRPELSVAYGITRVGDVTLDVTTPTSATEDIVDAGDVSVGMLRLTPEILVPFDFYGAAYDSGELRIAPSLGCEIVTTTHTKRDCGGGLELEWSSFSDDRTQEFSALVSRDVIGDTSRSSVGIAFRHNF